MVDAGAGSLRQREGSPGPQVSDLDPPGEVGSDLPERGWSFSPVSSLPSLLTITPSSFHMEQTSQAVFSHLGWTIICK